MLLVNDKQNFFEIIHPDRSVFFLASQQYTVAIIRPDVHADGKTSEIIEKVNRISLDYSNCILSI